MKEAVKVGVIGIGQMGTYHAQVYQKLPQAELAAICEYDDEKRAAAEKEFNCKGYKDYKELLEDPEIEAVSIVLPDNMHREAVEIAVKNNKHILLEKPLAKELEDGKVMYELTKDYDKVFSVGFLLRYDPRFAMIKQRLDEGELGDIIHIYCRRNSPIIGPRRYVGASDLSMHVMIHDIDYINWYMGCEPVKVFAKSRSVLLKENGMNDVIYAIVTYENGAIACMEACWVLPETSPTIIDDKLELVGTKGVAYVDSCDNGVRFVTDKKVQYPDTRHWYYVNGELCGDLAEEIMAFINNVASGTKSIITPKEAYDSLRVVDAIERSIAEEREVEL
ncbi:Gfo/Idh/MocA family protein [Faecalicatena contorta]|jgi:UDP-N-acetylglucosamine 3-dehydrogenase|uniref:UDP-N-acetylglucosamine 3-dehydrogenase n=1 Tax=Faecalicatena contorta TaxID=39482 RepID=A0A315ZTH3_9FIRM|nr:Gfo/Idh/MocA family oxidoreductase [Faecalicatena contorta]MBA4698406.1 Gfo/Idh/MocA family oxidoreductase [Ruminococcus sp.]PWJ48612.1 UDP-N-acetylglucosamine 3-dehydrogenase [Faecalicatena contorta]SUQ15348.1 UDP-N-acetylglucosamine 3-dehydrogenase [Faecalicatena contorta]